MDFTATLLTFWQNKIVIPHRIFQFFLVAATGLATLPILANPSQIKIEKYDFDRDGLAEIVAYSYKNMSATIRIKGGQIQSMKAQRSLNKIISQNIYEPSQGNYILVYKFATTDRVFHNTENCESIDDPFMSASEVGLAVNAAKVSIFPIENCSAKMETQIQTALSKFSSPEGMHLGECLALVDPDIASKWKTMPNTLTAKSISCSSSPDPKGTFDLDRNQISISNSCDGKTKELEATLTEELLHSFGDYDEHKVDCVIKHCPTGANAARKCIPMINPDDPSQVQLLSTATKSTTPEAGNAFNNNKQIAVPQQIAAAQVTQPSISDLRVNQSVTTSFEPVGGNSFGNRMMALVQNTILPDKAFAAEPSTRLANSGSGNTRSPAAARTGSSIPNLNINTASSSIPSSAISANVGTGSTNSPTQIAGSQKTVEANPAKPGNRQGVAAAAGTRAVAAGGGSAGRGIASTGGSGSSEAATANAAAGTQSFANLPRAELLKVLNIPANYPDIQRNLKDPNFVEALRRAGIRIVDGRKGISVGAPQGQTVFTDTGKQIINNNRR